MKLITDLGWLRSILGEARPRLTMASGPYAFTNAQLAIENLAKVLIALYQEPTWSYDPSNQLMSIVDNIPGEYRDGVRWLAELAHRLAPEHSRSIYGEPDAGLTPDMLYNREFAESIMVELRKAHELVHKILRTLDVI